MPTNPQQSLHSPNTRTTIALPLLLFGFIAAALLAPFAGAGASEDIDIVGEVVLEHADDFRGRSEELRVLESDRGRFVLTGSRADEARDGTRVRVRGKRRGENIVLADGGSVNTLGTSDSTSDSTTLAASTSVGKRVAVLLINFTDPEPSPTPTASADPSATPSPSPSPTPTPPPPSEPWTKAFVHGLYFTNTRSVASYFAEASNDKLSVSGDVFGYYTLATSTATCNYADWGYAARQAASAAGVNLSSYDFVVHAFPRQSSCWWGGLAQLSGRFNWINGSMTPYVTMHELGHTLGVHHAASMTCTKSGTRVSISSSCSVSEYGDPFDVMGQGASGPTRQRHVNNWHRRQLGFLGSSDQLTVTKNGHYRVATAQVDGGTPRIVRVPRPSTGDYYYLELRQPYGFYDDFSSTAAVVNGVLVRIAPDTKRVQSKLLDMNPSTSSFSDAALGVGQAFNDGANNVSITTNWISSRSASLRIQVGPDTVPPSTPGNLKATIPSPSSIALQWTISSDDLEVTGYRVSRDGKVLGTVPDTSFTDNSVTAGVTYNYSVVALDGASNASQPATVSQMMPDQVAPSVPGNVTVAQTGTRAVRLSWTAATDNGTVAGYRIRRNGTLLGSTASTTFDDLTVVDGHSYEYAVRAVDAAGNLSPFVAAQPSRISLADVTPPSAPGTIRPATTGSSASFSWAPATDNVAVTGYRVSRDGRLVATLAASATSFSESSLPAGTYQYSVFAFDAAANAGPAMTASVTVAAPDTTPPSAPTKLTGTPRDYRYVDLTWQASTDNASGTISYRILRDGVRIATVTTTSYRDRAPSVGTYSYKVRAVDAAGNKSPFSPVISVKAVKSVASVPSTPANFKGTSLNRRYIELTWSPSTGGAAGTMRYRLFRNDVRIVTITGTRYVDRPASVGTYRYKVRAVDPAGNKSPFTPNIYVKAVRAV